MEAPLLWRCCAVMAISAKASRATAVSDLTGWYHPFYFDRCYDQLLPLA